MIPEDLDRFGLGLLGILLAQRLLDDFDGLLVGFGAGMLCILAARVALVAARDYFRRP